MKVPGGTPQLQLVILRPISKRTPSKRALTRRKLYQPLQVSGDLTPQKLLHPTPWVRIQIQTGIVYSCNCEKQFYNSSSGPRHLKKAHGINTMKRGEYSTHISFVKKKYSCKICYSNVIHTYVDITVHMKIKHNLTMDQYEKSMRVQKYLKINRLNLKKEFFMKNY